MIKQRVTTTKTATGNISVSEMGDILCSSASTQTYTLPAVSKGLWYRFSNIGTGNVIISDGTNIALLTQDEQCIVVNDETNWYAFKITSESTILAYAVAL